VFLVVQGLRHTLGIAEMIKPVLAEDGFMVGLQNGMTHVVIADVVGLDRTVGAVIQIASNMWVPGVTNRQNDYRRILVRARRGGSRSRQDTRWQRWRTLLRHSGTVEVDGRHSSSAKWMKLVVNAAELDPVGDPRTPNCAARRGCPGTG
jgi:2-dehydropantoate 2-reductase